MVKFLKNITIVIVLLLGIGLSKCYATVVYDTSGDVVTDSSNDPVSDTNGPPLAAPSITTQPANATVTAPATATFSVVATGTPVPTYQWMQEASGATSFTAISGATSAAYTTPATTTANSGTKYECVVTNSAGSVTSSAATLIVNATNPTPSVLGWWPLDTVSGATTPDLSGNGYTGTLNNGPILVTGKIGNALSFNGSNQYVSVANFSSNISSSSTLTVSCWVDNVSGASGGACGMRANDDAPGAMYILLMGSNTLETRIRTNTGVATWDSGAVLTAGAWNLVTLVYNGSTLVTYVNGVAVNTQTAALSTFGVNSIPFWIGNETWNGSGLFANYAIDDVRIYNTALTSSNVAALYAAAGTGTAPGITTQPASATVTAPTTATFNVVATGTPTPTYQWMQEASGATSFTAISGATSVVSHK